jgi:hypothetical protein
MSQVLGIVYRCIATHLTKKAGFLWRDNQDESRATIKVRKTEPLCSLRREGVARAQ